MSHAGVGLVAGIALMLMFGWQLFKAIRTDRVRVGRWSRGRWMRRSENPRLFWMNVIGMSVFFGLGVFVVAQALISPETFY